MGSSASVASRSCTLWLCRGPKPSVTSQGLGGLLGIGPGPSGLQREAFGHAFSLLSFANLLIILPVIRILGVRLHPLVGFMLPSIVPPSIVRVVVLCTTNHPRPTIRPQRSGSTGGPHPVLQRGEHGTIQSGT